MTDTAVEIEPKGLILLVDDVARNLQVLCTMLGREKYRIAVARDGKQALEMVKKVKPDLILLDVMMPEISGFEVCKQLNDSQDTWDIPIIFLTAKTETEDIVKGFEYGAVDYVTKPFSGTELLARVRTHLELKRAREELIKKNKELMVAKEKLDLAARTDPLTQLSNRRDILEKIEYEKVRFERGKRPFTMILGDVDNFKSFNDLYGHSCGDTVLTAVARLMKSLVRKQDCVARWGGEEFLVLLPETDIEGGITIAEKIRDAIENHTILFNEKELSITITFGVATYGSNCSRSIDDCIRSVDLAMYAGKQKGKNCVSTAPEVLTSP
jgi:diguanylate cyclase (GGDEF)-like protein